MSARIPVVLLLVAIVLLGYIFAFERGRPGRSEINARTGLLLEGVVRDRITGVRIASGEQRIELRRDGEGFDETWTIEEPEAGPADAEPVEDYLRNWEFAVPVRTLENPSEEDLERFGMDAARGEVSFEMGRGVVRISLGSGSPVDGGGYVQVDGDKSVMVVGDDVVELFHVSAESFAASGDGGAPMLEDLMEEGEQE